MRELTFTGFLQRYVRSLSLANTNSIYVLAREAATDNYRMREPLLLYALFTGKTAILRQAAKDTDLAGVYEDVLSRYTEEQMLTALERKESELPTEYHKIWRSFLVQRNRKNTDEQTKELMRQRILTMQKEKGVSNYRIYKELNLNPGNINDWLKNGAGIKVSLSTARKAFQYMENY